MGTRDTTSGASSAPRDTNDIERVLDAQRKLIERIHRDLETAERNLELFELVLGGLQDHLPSEFTLTKAHSHSSYADLCVEGEMRSLDDTLVFCERMNPDALVRIRCGFLGYYPVECKRATELLERENIDATYIAPYIYVLDNDPEHGESKTFIFYHTIYWAGGSETRIEFRVRVTGDDRTRRIIGTRSRGPHAPPESWVERVTTNPSIAWINYDTFSNHHARYMPNRVVLWTL